MSGKRRENPATETETKYTAGQLKVSVRYRGHRDLLDALLKEDKTYTFTEVEELIEKFMKGKVD